MDHTVWSQDYPIYPTARGFNHSACRVQTLETRRLRRADLLLTYQLLHNLLDYDWRNILTLAPSDRTRGHPLKLAKFHSRLDVRRHSFAFRVVTPWNNLPSAVVMAPSVQSFKRKLHDSGALGEQ